MTTPASLSTAYELSPHLTGLNWAIGGSTLLHHLGIEPAPVDLDIVVTPEHFGIVEARLSARLTSGQRPAHPRYQSTHFKRFVAPSGVAVEIMAGIAVVDDDQVRRWEFKPDRVEHQDGLPWMLPEDWITLYKLFNRPARVEQLEAYLRRQTQPG